MRYSTPVHCVDVALILLLRSRSIDVVAESSSLVLNTCGLDLGDA